MNNGSNSQDDCILRSIHDRRGIVYYQRAPMRMTWFNGPAATTHLDNFQSLCVGLFSRLPTILHTSRCDLAKERAMGDMTEPSKPDEEMPSCQIVYRRGRWVLIRGQRRRQMTIIKSVLPSRST